MTYDYSRAKYTLVGCLGLTVIAFVGLFVSIKRITPRPKQDGKPCILAPERLRPVLSGDTARLKVGTSQFADCLTQETPGFEWSSSNPVVAEVTPEGIVRGKSNGTFTAVATSGSETLTADGFVLPPEWRARIEPDSIHMRVGDSVAVVIRALDQTGTHIPGVPFSVFAPEFFDPIRNRKPIVNKYSWADAVVPVYVLAADTGTSILLGRIGFQQVTAKLTILPRR